MKPGDPSVGRYVVRNDDDEHREQRRPAHFRRRIENHESRVPLLLLPFAQVAEDVFQHDDRTVDDDAEIHRPQ